MVSSTLITCVIWLLVLSCMSAKVSCAIYGLLMLLCYGFLVTFPYISSLYVAFCHTVNMVNALASLRIFEIWFKSIEMDYVISFV